MACIFSQAQIDPAHQRIYPEKLHEDIAVLRTTLLEAHPAPYRFTNAAELERAFARVRDSVVVPMSPADLLAALQPVFQAVGDPRFHASGGSTSLGVLPNSVLIPLRVQVSEDALFVVEELKGFRSLPTGARILSINGRRTEEILRMLRRHVVAEGAIDSYRNAIISAHFPQLLHRHVDQASTFEIIYTEDQGPERSARIVGLSTTEMEMYRRNGPVRSTPWGHEMLMDDRACWLTIHTLDAGSLEEVGVRPERYLESLRKELHRKRTEAVVIDLRGAGGADMELAAMVFAQFAEMPFRVMQGLSTRRMQPPTHYGLAQPMPTHFTYVRERFEAQPDGTFALPAMDARFVLQDPVKDPFPGKVLLVCDGLTRDAAAALTMLAKRTGRARVIGEETGTNATTFTGGDVLHLTLPNSGLTVQIPMLLYRPDGEPTTAPDRGESPHHRLTPRSADLARGRDTVREAVLHLLQEI